MRVASTERFPEPALDPEPSSIARINEGAIARLHTCTPAACGVTLQRLTGSVEHNKALDEIASRAGLRIVTVPLETPWRSRPGNARRYPSSGGCQRLESSSRTAAPSNRFAVFSRRLKRSSNRFAVSSKRLKRSFNRFAVSSNRFAVSSTRFVVSPNRLAASSTLVTIPSTLAPVSSIRFA
jgi:hypothetical protein